MQSGDMSANEGSAVEVQLKLWSGATATTAGGSLAIFAYQGTAHVTDVQPSVGITSSWQMLTVIGTGFVVSSSSVTCRLSYTAGNGVKSDVVLGGAAVSFTQVLCERHHSDQDLEGGAVVEVSFNGADFTSDGVGLKFLKMATVTKAVPSWASVIGSETVTLIGKHFVRAYLHATCVFGGAMWTTPANWYSSSLVTCAVPVRPAGNVTLTLSGEDIHCAGSFGVVFGFRDSSSVTFITIRPSQGPLNGGTVVTCLGSWQEMLSSLRCRVGHAFGLCMESKQLNGDVRDPSE